MADGTPAIAYLRMAADPMTEGAIRGSVMVAMATSASPAGETDWTITEVASAPMPCRPFLCDGLATCLEMRLMELGYSVEELTRERFVPDPFSDHGGGGEPPRMFRTGDAGRFVETAGGELAVELHGRVAFMIKLRGYSIVPGNVESAILSHAAVDACCVKGNTDKGNTDFLVAYCVPTKGSEMPKDAEMKDFLKGLLPYYSIPSVFVALDEMPISETSGKLDRKRLPKAEAPGAVAAAGQTASGGAPNGAPRATYRVTQMERKVVAAWCDVIPSLAAATAAMFPVGGVPARITWETLSGRRLAYSSASTPRIEWPRTATRSAPSSVRTASRSSAMPSARACRSASATRPRGSTPAC